VNGDATESDPQAVLSGDSNIGTFGTATASTPATYAMNGTATVATTAPLAKQLAPGGSPAAWTTANSYWSWTSGYHQKAGNLGISDGSVQQVSINGLHQALQNSTNTISNPAFSFLW